MKSFDRLTLRNLLPKNIRRMHSSLFTDTLTSLVIVGTRQTNSVENTKDKSSPGKGGESIARKENASDVNSPVK